MAEERKMAVSETFRVHLIRVSVAVLGLLIGMASALLVLPEARRLIDGGSDIASTGVARVGGPFRLTTADGRIVTDKDFHGRDLIVFFGYTDCPQICKAGLQALADALARLGGDAGRFAPVFITLDPRRDTPERLARFLGRYDARIVGLTGTEGQIAEIAKAYYVHPERVQNSAAPGGYRIDYQALFFLMDRRGRYVTHFSYATPVADIVALLKQQL